MARIRSIRPVLLSAPYAAPAGNAEVILHLPHGLRTTGLVEITLDNGIKGLGEGYLAVFAPRVFVEIARLLAPIVEGRDVRDLPAIVRNLQVAAGYWSYQGAAQHVVAAFEIALQDARAQLLGIPLWKALGGTMPKSLPAYASGGDSVSPEFMREEFRTVADLGIRVFKIRARNTQVQKAHWCQRVGAGQARAVTIAVDMTQNLAIPSQTVEEVLAFERSFAEAGLAPPAFLEEVLGPLAVGQLPTLRGKSRVPIAGGEIVTTAMELGDRIHVGSYDIAQPDATVIGGVGPVMDVFAAARHAGTAVYVHCWGGGVGMLANYHAAVAGGGEMVEWPLPAYALREALWPQPIAIVDGHLALPERPGLGAILTDAVEREFPFREDAVYHCLVDPTRIPPADWR